jgi:hypothetical protein
MKMLGLFRRKTMETKNQFRPISIWPLIIGLFVCLSLFLFPQVNTLVVENAPLGTGLIALLSTLSAGFINAILNAVQANTIENRTMIELQHSSNERKAQRTQALIDEKFAVINHGFEEIGTQFQLIRERLIQIPLDYHASQTKEELAALVSNITLNSPTMFIFAAHIGSLRNKALGDTWDKLVDQFDALVNIFNDLIRELTRISTIEIAQRPREIPMDLALRRRPIELAFHAAASDFQAILYEERKREA